MFSFCRFPLTVIQYMPLWDNWVNDTNDSDGFNPGQTPSDFLLNPWDCLYVYMILYHELGFQTFYEFTNRKTSIILFDNRTFGVDVIIYELTPWSVTFVWDGWMAVSEESRLCKSQKLGVFKLPSRWGADFKIWWVWNADCHANSLFRLYLLPHCCKCSIILYKTWMICIDDVFTISQHCVKRCLH
jgi:hypothetical protein